MFPQLDMPVSPGNKGQRQFVHNISDDLRHQYRQALVGVTKEDMLSVIDK